MPGIEYVLVFVIAFSSGYELGKEKNCGHQHIIIKHKPWYTLHIQKDFCLHHNPKKCKNKKHKRKWKKYKRRHWRW